jgi:hypothetical protein
MIFYMPSLLTLQAENSGSVNCHNPLGRTDIADHAVSGQTRWPLSPRLNGPAAFAALLPLSANRLDGPPMRRSSLEAFPFSVLSMLDSQCRRRKAAREQEALQWRDPWQAPQFHRPSIMRMMHSRPIHENAGTTPSTSLLIGAEQLSNVRQARDNPTAPVFVSLKGCRHQGIYPPVVGFCE